MSNTHLNDDNEIGVTPLIDHENLCNTHMIDQDDIHRIHWADHLPDIINIIIIDNDDINKPNINCNNDKQYNLTLTWSIMIYYETHT